MKKLLLLLLILSSCAKEEISVNTRMSREDILLKKPINYMTLSIDSLTVYRSNEDWFSVSNNRNFNIYVDFYHIDSLGNKINLTSILKRNSNDFNINYELNKECNSKILILDKKDNNEPLGLLFLLNTTLNESGSLTIKLYKDTLLFETVFPFIVSAP